VKGVGIGQEMQAQFLSFSRAYIFVLLTAGPAMTSSMATDDEMGMAEKEEYLPLSTA